MVGVVTDDFKVSQDKTVAATERGWAYMQGTGGIAHAEENPTENYSDYGEKFTTEHDIVDVDVDRFLGRHVWMHECREIVYVCVCVCVRVCMCVQFFFWLL